MHIKHFTMSGVRVPDPMRPGRTAVVGRLSPSGSTSLFDDGRTYEPDENGWFDVPHEVGTKLCRFRQKGSGFYTPGEVVDQVRLGGLEQPDQPAPQRPARAKAPGKTTE